MVTTYQLSILRDMRDGHFTMWHDPQTGEDICDRQIRGGVRVWLDLVSQGAVELLPSARTWTVTTAFLALLPPTRF